MGQDIYPDEAILQMTKISETDKENQNIIISCNRLQNWN